jgi:fructokinase
MPDFISRIGNDAEGLQIKQAMQQWGMSLENLQTDPKLPTGSVQVSLVDDEPYYDIVDNQAYDFIAENQIKADCYAQGVLYHGTLCLRHQLSAATLDKLIAGHAGKIFVDVNLRVPWWQPRQVGQLLDRADWAKLNEDELMQLQSVDIPLKNRMRQFRSRHNLDTLIVTRGGQGVIAINKHNEFFEATPCGQACIVDTVGAGDAFSAVALLGLQLNWPLPVILQRAQDFAFALLARRGATVQDISFYQAYIHAWQLAHLIED